VLEKEIERLGIPCVLITTLIPAALTIGANRIVQGVAITNPLGNPELSSVREKELRRDIVRKALEVLEKKIDPLKSS
jgi:glycine reductase complex component B subunit gamma